ASTPFLSVAKTWMAGHRRAESTPSFGRLCPAMTTLKRRSKRPPASYAIALPQGGGCSEEARLLPGLTPLARTWRAHGDELFGRGRMQGHCCVEIGFRRLHFHGDRDRLDDFGGAVADDVTADDAIGKAIVHELHQHARVAARQRCLQRPERRLVD